MKLAQPAQVKVTVRRRGRTVAILANDCVAKKLKVRWNGRDSKGRARHGRFRVRVAVKSDRKTVVRRKRISLR